MFQSSPDVLSGIRFVYGTPNFSEFPGCRLTDSGAEYKGDIHHTRSGLECLPWTLVDSAFKSDDANHCRNPDNKPDGPWCYTGLDDLSWEHCNVPFCKRESLCYTGITYYIHLARPSSYPYTCPCVVKQSSSYPPRTAYRYISFSHK